MIKLLVGLLFGGCFGEYEVFICFVKAIVIVLS